MRKSAGPPCQLYSLIFRHLEFKAALRLGASLYKIRALYYNVYTEANNMRTGSRALKSQMLTFRVSREEKAVIEVAAKRSGSDVTTFVLAPALARAREIAEPKDFTVLTGAARKQFSLLLERATSPSKTLLRNLSSARYRTVR